MPSGVYKRHPHQGFQKGQPSWNKNKKCPYMIGNQYAKGNPPNKTSFKKGQRGKESGNWKNGKTIDSSGYILIYKPEHPFPNNGRYVFEHRLVVESQIGRYLLPTESCHHLNGIKDDNRPKNLMAFKSDSAHQRFHHNPNNVKSEEITFDGRKLHK